jgi:hypothetical protein
VISPAKRKRFYEGFRLQEAKLNNVMSEDTEGFIKKIDPRLSLIDDPLKEFEGISLRKQGLDPMHQDLSPHRNTRVDPSPCRSVSVQDLYNERLCQAMADNFKQVLSTKLMSELKQRASDTRSSSPPVTYRNGFNNRLQTTIRPTAPFAMSH